MTPDEARRLAEIEARHDADGDELHRTFEPPEILVACHIDRAWLIAALKASEAEVAALTEDISRALDAVTAENEARVASEAREARLREAASDLIQYEIDGCHEQPIKWVRWEEKFEALRAALKDTQP